MRTWIREMPWPGLAAEPRTAASDEHLSVIVSHAELAECTCPEVCERDHDDE